MLRRAIAPGTDRFQRRRTVKGAVDLDRSKPFCIEGKPCALRERLRIKRPTPAVVHPARCPNANRAIRNFVGGLDFRMPHGELPFVVAVAVSAAHGFIKQLKPSIRLIARLGAAGDAHRGASVQHLYDKRKDPLRPNLRQIHLIEAELMDALNELGFPITPGALGENIVTRNLALLRLSEGTELQLGRKARLTITGLRTPCAKIDSFQKGLRRSVTVVHGRHKIMKGAVMAVVTESGTVRSGDAIHIVEPEASMHRPLRPI
jgi:hypothetical protein